MSWGYKTSRVNFQVATNTDGELAVEGDTLNGRTNAKIDGIASDATVAQATTLVSAFYGTITPFNNYDELTKTMVVIAE